jgi:hypothetical protein
MMEKCELVVVNDEHVLLGVAATLLQCSVDGMARVSRVDQQTMPDININHPYCGK